MKLIAEPWDVGEGGYQVGNFPVLWQEWNGKYRDCLRAYWKGDMGLLGELAYRLTGSADLFEWGGRRPYASVNILTAHDGFTLYDTVAYNDKHNEANGENNQDGHNDNRSWNCGAEGPTDDEGINALRRKQLRNFLATLLLSQGVPMIVGGDEFGRTQKGNNNAYCQDNEISWFHWEHADWQKKLIEFTARLIQERKKHPIFRRPKYFQGRRVPRAGLKDLMWFDTDGSEMNQEDWTFRQSLPGHAALRRRARRARSRRRARARRYLRFSFQRPPRDGEIRVARQGARPLGSLSRHQGRGWVPRCTRHLCFK